MFRPALIPLLMWAIFSVPQAGIAQEYLWCFDADQILLDLHPADHTLTIDHRAAMYNCCPEPFQYQLESVPGVVEITETVLEEAPCDCICCFNTKVEVGPLSSGSWTIRFHWFDTEHGQWTVVEELVEVPPHEGDGGPAVLGQWPGDCLDAAPVPGPEIEPLRWDALKSRYLMRG